MRAIAIASLFVLLASNDVLAYSGPEQTLGELAEASGLVLVGTVDEIENIGPPVDSGLWPLTRYQICDFTVVAGSLPKNKQDDDCFELDAPGGLMDDGLTGYSMGGMPRLERGKRYLLFLSSYSPYAVPWAGWDQGIYEVKGDRDGGWLFTLSGFPLAFIRSDGSLGAGPTRATWLEEHPEASETDVPLEIIAESPVSVVEMVAELSKRKLGAMPDDWRANQRFGSSE